VKNFPLVLLLSLAACPASAPPPAVPEPDAGAFGPADPAWAEPWTKLLSYRPDRAYPDDAAREAAGREVASLQSKLSSSKPQACAAGAARFGSSRDGVERFLIGLYLRGLAGKEGEPFLVKAMADLADPDPVFPAYFGAARQLAATRAESVLPAVLGVLRTRSGKAVLTPEDRTLETPECVAYVLLSWGRDLVPKVRERLADGDGRVRRNAAFALGVLLDDASLPVLARMAAEDREAAAGAAFALGELGALPQRGAIERLLSSASADDRFWAAYALFELREPAAGAALKAALEREPEGAAREEMAAALKHLAEGAKAYGAGAERLGGAALESALKEAESTKGWEYGRARSLAASCTRAHEQRLRGIREASTEIPTGRGALAFRAWGAVLREARRRPATP
jgi:hypothetical protein